MPLGFCTVTHALARAADLRFLPVEAGTPLRLLRAHAAGLLAVALPELPLDVARLPLEPPEPVEDRARRRRAGGRRATSSA